jgi:cytochrome b
MPMASDANRRTVLVWDLPTRLFHWCVVILVFVSWLSADRGWMKGHLVSGLSLLALLLFRILWGLAGSTTARFTNFLHPPQAVLGYLKSLKGGGKMLYAGHNPAGGLMVAAMIAVLLAQALSGLFANDGVHFNGPLSLLVPSEVSDQVTGLHKLIFNLILLLVWCHVVAVGFYLLVRRDNLVLPMFTGRKPLSHVPNADALVFSRLSVALLLFFISAAIAAWIMIQGGSLL